MRVDAHHHLWDLQRFNYVWMGPELEALRRNFAPAGLRPLVQRHAIDLTVLVQTISNIEETRWFLRLAQEHRFIGGVVGWVDLTSADVAEQLQSLQSEPGPLVGIRHQVHDEPDDHWLLRSDVRRGLRAVADSGLAYDLLIRPQHLSVAATIAHEFEDMRLVVDHIAKPDIVRGLGWDKWSIGMKTLGACENVFCKLSGMITEADWRDWQPSDLHRYIDHVIESFGPDRVMFGSDWPVCLLAGDYDRVVTALAANLSYLSNSEQEKIWGQTAINFYQLEHAR